MELTAGTRLGQYEILAPIGKGGMGEVYRARDTKLNRDVAIKILPPAWSLDPERRARFEREAQAVASLSHPSILAIHDFGEASGITYAVMELLHGESLRDRLASGALPVRKAVEYGNQIAAGLAAAHDRGIIHRDLKPENVFVLDDGQVKILDFGLARQLLSQASLAETRATAGTAAGVVLGTVGYMAPEQVRGETADQRADVFAFGVVLYEMLTGRRAFARETPADTMTAILRDEPPDMTGDAARLPAALDRIVRHCLEKNPRARFQSASDIGFALQSLTASNVSGPAAAVPAPSTGRRGWVAAAALGGAVLAGAAFLAGRATGGSVSRTMLQFEPKTFAAQAIFDARFAPDGKTIVYTGALEGHTPRTYVIRPDDREPQALGRPGTRLLSVSSKGELAVLTGAAFINHRIFKGTLARMAVNGAPRPVLEEVREADWSPDGSELAIVREVGGMDRLEYPADTILYETSGYVSDIRISPDGTRIAFMDHQLRYDDRGWVKVVDRSKRITTLDGEFNGEQGLAWAPDGKAVLYSGRKLLTNVIDYQLWAAPAGGGARAEVVSSAGGLTIHDVAADGRLLSTRSESRLTMVVRGPGDTTEREVGWLSNAISGSMSSDGRSLLFTDQSQGQDYGVAQRLIDGSPSVHLGDGAAQDLSRDRRWAAALLPSSGRVVLYPTGVGQSTRLEAGPIARADHVRFYPDSRSILVCGSGPGKPRCYQQDLSGGPPRPVTPEGTFGAEVASDGRTVLARTADKGWMVFTNAGDAGRQVPGLDQRDSVLRFSPDGATVFVYRHQEVPARVEGVDLSSGRRTLLREFAPADRAGLIAIHTISLADDPRAYAYTFWRYVSTLYVVTR